MKQLLHLSAVIQHVLHIPISKLGLIGPLSDIELIKHDIQVKPS
jgi:hypothetical protein